MLCKSASIVLQPSPPCALCFVNRFTVVVCTGVQYLSRFISLHEFGIEWGSQQLGGVLSIVQIREKLFTNLFFPDVSSS